MLEKKEQYKHEFWLRKRDEILNRDNYKCQICGKNSDLQVHHICYFPDRHVWDYDNELLQTVCREHHEILTFVLPKLSGIIAFKMLQKNLDFNSVYDLLNNENL